MRMGIYPVRNVYFFAMPIIFRKLTLKSYRIITVLSVLHQS